MSPETLRALPDADVMRAKLPISPEENKAWISRYKGATVYDVDGGVMPLSDVYATRPFILASLGDEIQGARLDDGWIVDIENADTSAATLDEALSPAAASGVLAAFIDMVDLEQQQKRAPLTVEFAEQLRYGDPEEICVYEDREGQGFDVHAALSRLVAGSLMQLISDEERAGQEVTTDDVEDTFAKMMGYRLYQHELDEGHELIASNTVEGVQRLLDIIDEASRYAEVSTEWQHVLADGGIEVTESLLRKLEIAQKLKQTGENMKVGHYENSLLPTYEGAEFALRLALRPIGEQAHDYASLLQILRSSYLLNAPHSEDEISEAEVAANFKDHFGLSLDRLIDAVRRRDEATIGALASRLGAKVD